MKIKYLSFILFSLLLQFNALGQETEPANKDSVKQYKHSLGVAAGWTTGNGLSYRYWPGKFGAQATFGLNVQDRLSSYSAGITFLYKIAETDVINFYAYEGNHFRMNEYTRFRHQPYGNPNEVEETEQSFNMGVGIGLEFIIAKRLSLNVMAGYSAVNNFEQYRITAEGGLYFKF